MQKPPRFAIIPFLLAGWVTLCGQSVTLPMESPKATVSQTIGITEVSVVYHRPSVNKREIWGKLVPYGYNDLGFGTAKAAPWRAGANENTVITFQHDVAVAGKPLKAGSYGLAMGIAPDGTVTLVFSRDTALWGTFFYEQSRDALRVDVKWEDAPFHELLTYDFTDVTKNSAVLALSWEKKRIPVPIRTDTDANVVANFRNELHNSKGFHAHSWVDASEYLLANNLDLPLALEWAESAISNQFFGERNYRTLANKARVLEKLGRAAEAKTVMDEALKLATVVQVHQYGRWLLTDGKTERAMEIFQLNASLHPNTWPVNYGLARGYSALGNYKAALEALLKAQKEIPAGDTVNAAAITTNIEKLKRGENIN